MPHVLHAALGVLLLAVPVLAAPGSQEQAIEHELFSNPIPPAAPFISELVSAPEITPAGTEAELRFRLKIPAEHYVYAERTGLEVLPGPELEILGIDAPEPVVHYDTFLEEEVQVYKQDTEFVARLRPGASTTVTAVLSYQGCNKSVCFFPQSDTLRVELAVEGVASPAQTTSPPETAGNDGPGAGVRDRLRGVLARNFGNPLIALVMTFVLGLLSAATPCVYPMIPITARILMGRGGNNPALGRAHAFAYFFGITLVYAVLGLIAGATGGSFNQIMRQPAVILAMAVLFALLGLSMLGLFEIQLPASFASRIDSSTSRRSGLLGTSLMGAGAGLVVSPCVGPVVVFVLTQIAAQIAAATAGSGNAFSATGPLLYGSYLMAGYGAGLAVPFLIVGLFSVRSMARPGAWMQVVRVALGIVILYFAYDYFLKAMDTAGVARAFSRAMVLGAVLIFLAVFWGAFRTRIEDGPHAGWQKVRLASSILMLIVGVFFLWTGLSRSGLVGTASPVSLNALSQAADTRFEDTDGLVWHRDFATASQEARNNRQPIFIDFYAHWCANCKVFGRQASAQGPLREALESVVRAKIYDTDPIYTQFENDPRFPELKVGLPFFVILSSDGELLWKGNDYRAHQIMIQEMARARSREPNV